MKLGMEQGKQLGIEQGKTDWNRTRNRTSKSDFSSVYLWKIQKKISPEKLVKPLK